VGKERKKKNAEQKKKARLLATASFTMLRTQNHISFYSS
jgi:hypothetical protein